MLKYCSHVGASSRKYPLDNTEFIAPMDAYPYEKKHLHTSFKYLSTLKYYLKVL